jgi:NADH-quinone oxidoreductase subunit L
MICFVCFGLFLPLAGFLILLFSSDYIGRCLAGIVGCASIFFAFLFFSTYLVFYTNTAMDPEVVTFYRWIPIDGINADFSLKLDHLTLLMTLIITGIGFLIHFYSIGYMEHEEDYARYFACMNLFVFAMLLLVLAGNLVLLFVGWEGVGLVSYLLIGYFYHRPAAAAAATKAFVVNRVGDVGLLLGLLLTFQTFGTADITEINLKATQMFAVGAPILTILTLLYFFGATGKSAQIPLQTWLADAMEGPTPVSALIHAATMVTAGVYLVVRLHPIFMQAPITLQIVGVIGAVTSLYAALSACGQLDLKRVLAYSTVSQLGLMFLACGAGAFYSAMFHITTHAFVKATLFLSAGNVLHMMNGTTNMEKMGGLGKKMPVTRALFLIGVLALSGIPPLATYFSKDLILEQEYLHGFDTLFYLGLAASILTGFYMTRAYCLTFTGAPRIDEKILKVVKEAPKMMLFPVLILGFLSIVGGFLGFAFGKTPLLEGFLAEVGITMEEKELSSGIILSPEMFMAVGGAFLGVGSAFLVYLRYANQLGPAWSVLRSAFYFDYIYHWIFVVPLEGFARFIARFLEPKLFDGMISETALTVQQLARGLQKFQSGEIRSYAAWMVLGTVLLLAYFVF